MNPPVKYDGDGLTWNLGGGAIIYPCADCGWFTTVEYNYSRLNKIDVTRDPMLDAGPQATVTRADYTFEASTHRIDGTVGYAFAYVAPFAGIRGSFHKQTLQGEGRAEAIGFPLALEFEFDNPFERNKAMALVGFDVRIPSTKIYVRVTGASNGDDHSFAANVSCGLF